MQAGLGGHSEEAGVDSVAAFIRAQIHRHVADAFALAVEAAREGFGNLPDRYPVVAGQVDRRGEAYGPAGKVICGLAVEAVDQGGQPGQTRGGGNTDVAGCIFQITGIRHAGDEFSPVEVGLVCQDCRRQQGYGQAQAQQPCR